MPCICTLVMQTKALQPTNSADGMCILMLPMHIDVCDIKPREVQCHVAHVHAHLAECLVKFAVPAISVVKFVSRAMPPTGMCAVLSFIEISSACRPTWVRGDATMSIGGRYA